MKRTMAGLLVGLVALVAGRFVLFGPRGERQVCVTERRMAWGHGKGGYELLDLGRREVWATRAFTEAEFQALSLPVLWPLWFKNDPRAPEADRAEFLRSPGCPEGAFTYLRAFGRTFVKVVDLKRLETVDGLRRVELEKHHVLDYEAGRKVFFLHSPSGERYIRVTRTHPPHEISPAVPPRWKITEAVLTEALRVDLTGAVTVLRLDNEDSYQGPLPSAETMESPSP